MKAKDEKQRWWRFGGWFGKAPVADANEGPLCPVIHGRAVARKKRFKAFLLLCAAAYLVFVVSTPFRPLAVQPPPAELLARYPEKPFVPRGDGRATRLLLSLDPQCSDDPMSATNPVNAELTANWNALPYDMCGLRTNRWQHVASPEVCAAMEALRPRFDALADAVKEEGYQRAEVKAEASPFTDMLPWWVPVLRFSRLQGLRCIDEGDRRAADAEIRKAGELGAFATRSDSWVSGLVGRVLAGTRLTELVVRNEESRQGGIEEIRAEMEFLDGLSRRLGPSTLAVSTERVALEDRIRVGSSFKAFAAALSPGSWLTFARKWKIWGGAFTRWDALLSFIGTSWLTGNDVEGVVQSSANWVAWERVSAEAALDPAGPDLEGLRNDPRRAAASPFCRLFRRGWGVNRSISNLSFVQMAALKEWHCRAELALARTVMLLAAYRAAAGREAESLDAAGSRLGWDIPEIPLTDRAVTYVRCPQGTGKETRADAYVLVCWGDGRMVPKNRGAAVLVVRNPAFGALPFRHYSWVRLTSDSRAGDPVACEVAWVDTDKPEAAEDAGVHGLKLPLGLLSPEPEAWSKGESYLRDRGWE